MQGFRLAVDSDAASIVELHCAVADDLTAFLGEGYWSKHRSLRAQRDRILQSSGDPRSRSIYVLEQEGEIIASVVLSTKRAHFWRKSLWAEPDADALCVFDLAVQPNLQRKGLGTRIMRFAEQRARECGVRWVRLDAFCANPRSNAFYDGLGYRNRGTITVSGVHLALYEKSV